MAAYFKHPLPPLTSSASGCPIKERQSKYQIREFQKLIRVAKQEFGSDSISCLYRMHYTTENGIERKVATNRMLTNVTKGQSKDKTEVAGSFLTQRKIIIVLEIIHNRHKLGR